MGMTVEPGQKEPDLDWIDRRFMIQKRLPDGSAHVLWLVGCNSAYRRQAILDAGMSDERFTGSAWSEDVDLSVRVRNLGLRFVYDPRVRLTHLALASGGCANRTVLDEEKRDEHRYRLFLFFALKNRAIIGNGETLLNVWRTYRNYAFNLPLLKSSLKSRDARRFSQEFWSVRPEWRRRSRIPRAPANNRTLIFPHAYTPHQTRPSHSGADPRTARGDPR